MWSTYCQPVSLLATRPDDLVAPNSATDNWVVTLNPCEGGVTNKVNEFDQSCMLDHSFWKSLRPLLDALKARTAGGPLWRFSYPELAR
eukprot:4414014-Pyramimonas_sp.AAC.1